jgi:SHAQKYF class myb-like DNA-binding protein
MSKVGGHNSPSFELCLNMAGCPGLPPPVLSALLCIIYEVTQRFDCFLCGFEGATPKAVLRVMGVQGITIYHVKSHLQVGLSPLYPSWHNGDLDFQLSVFCGDSNWRKYLTCLNPDVMIFCRNIDLPNICLRFQKVCLLQCVFTRVSVSLSSFTNQ